MSDYFQPVKHLSGLRQVDQCFIFKINTLTFEITKIFNLFCRIEHH